MVYPHFQGLNSSELRVARSNRAGVDFLNKESKDEESYFRSNGDFVHDSGDTSSRVGMGQQG